MDLTHLSLFSGIGGMDLAAELVGFETIAFVEWDKYCQSVLRKHWPKTPLWGDIRNVTVDAVRDVLAGRRLALLSGGYPCQPFSDAGERRGEADDRFLWPEMFRLVQGLRPAWVLGENVAGHVSLGLDGVLADLESVGYACQPFVIPACAVGAMHRRERTFVVAYTAGSGNGSDPGAVHGDAARHRAAEREQSGSGGQVVADTASYGCGKHAQHHSGPAGREPEPGLGGNPDGFPAWLDAYRLIAAWGEEQRPWEPPRIIGKTPHRTDRVKALGNTIMPWQVRPILQGIADTFPDV